MLQLSFGKFYEIIITRQISEIFQFEDHFFYSKVFWEITREVKKEREVNISMCILEKYASC